MIKYVKRKEIDIKKYDGCIKEAISSHIYGYAWYLDAVADQWDVLVEGDYTAVMPLPKRKKYGIPYVYRLPWVQQLGVFSKEKIPVAQMESFLRSIPRKFKLVELMINSSNPLPIKDCSKLTNFVLSLDKPYKELQKKYSKGRKSSIKQGKSLLTIKRTDDLNAIVALYKGHIGVKTGQDDSVYNKLLLLTSAAQERNLLEPYEVLNERHDLVGGAIFLKHKDRIIYLLSAINKEGREKQAMSFLLDYMIEKYAETKNLLDFEGSMIPEVASFMRSFGAIEEYYGHYKVKRLL